jgi:hypothetical protein
MLLVGGALWSAARGYTGWRVWDPPIQKKGIWQQNRTVFAHTCSGWQGAFNNKSHVCRDQNVVQVNALLLTRVTRLYVTAVEWRLRVGNHRALTTVEFLPHATFGSLAPIPQSCDTAHDIVIRIARDSNPVSWIRVGSCLCSVNSPIEGQSHSSNS